MKIDFSAMEEQVTPKFKGGEKEQTFPIERLCGKGKIELIFLPGSNFDLEAIQFARGQR